MAPWSTLAGGGDSEVSVTERTTAGTATTSARVLGLDLRAPDLPRPTAWITAAVLLVVAASRSPHLLVHGRLWAEEGVSHFRHAFRHPGLEGLFYVHPPAGYANLHANVSTWLAAQVRLELAPLVTTWLSLAVIAAVLWVVLTWPSRLLPTAGSRLVAAVLLVVGTLAFPEVWLNSINAQTYLGILTLLLAFVPVLALSRRRYVAGVVMLAIGGLSGLYSVALAPLFWLDAWRDRSRRSTVFAATITAAGLIQLWLLWAARNRDTLGESRFSLPAIEDLARSVGNQVSAVLLGHGPAGDVLRAGSLSARSAVAAAAGLALVALLGVLLWRAPDPVVPVKLAVAFVAVEAVIQVGAIGGVAGGRYAVVPMAILTLALVHGFAVADRRPLRLAAATGCAVVLVAGLAQFWTYRDAVVRCDDCPRWDAEVADYQAGESRRLEIWPYRGERTWILQLPPPGQRDP